MKRKTSTIPTQIWTYWCFPSNDPRVDRQFQLARAYKNKRIELELQRRAEIEELQSKQSEVAALDSRKAELDEAIEQLTKSIKQRRQKSRSNTVIPEKKRRELADLKTARKELYAKIRQARKCAREELKDYIQSINEQNRFAVKAAYNDSECCWGTKLLVDKEIEAAQSSVQGPRFRKWVGDGRIGVQFQKGEDASRLFAGKDTRLQIVIHDPQVQRNPNGAPLSSFRIRIGSDGRKPVWSEKFSFIYSRDIPPDARVKWAWVKRVNEGFRMRWSLQLVLEAPSFGAIKPVGTIRREACAIDLGWRAREERNVLRFGYIWDGAEGDELILPAKIKDRLEYADTLRAKRDASFNSVMPEFSRRLEDAMKSMGSAFSQNFQNRFSHLHQRRSANRFAKQVRWWKNNPSEGGCQELLDWIWHGWWLEENRLYRRESGTRSNALRSRDEFYRQTARKIARGYKRVFLEDLNLSGLARRKAPEHKDEELHQSSRRQRFQSSVSIFRRQLLEQCQKHGTEVVFVNPAKTTIACHACGHDEPWDKISLEHTCPACKASWDQDYNAAVNILRRGLASASATKKRSS